MMNGLDNMISLIITLALLFLFGGIRCLLGGFWQQVYSCKNGIEKNAVKSV